LKDCVFRKGIGGARRGTPPPCVPAVREAFWGGFAGFAYEQHSHYGCHHHRQQREKQACRRQRSGSSSNSKQWPAVVRKILRDGSKRTRREASSEVMHALYARFLATHSMHRGHAQRQHNVPSSRRPAQRAPLAGKTDDPRNSACCPPFTTSALRIG